MKLFLIKKNKSRKIVLDYWISLQDPIQKDTLQLRIIYIYRPIASYVFFSNLTIGFYTLESKLDERKIKSSL